MDGATLPPIQLRCAALHPPPAAKLSVERFWLLFTPVWGAIVGVTMLGRFAERWGDVELMILGVGLGAGAVLPPALFPREPEERAKPLLERTATRLGLTVVFFAFGMNYFTTPFFFDVLHMHYGFGARIVIRDNPVFLYFLTVAYFATYAALLLRALRFARARGRFLVALVPFVVAGLETALNANPFMKRLFCYDDARLALGFGTLAYGSCFCFTLPIWAKVDEDGERAPLARILVWCAAGLMGMLVVFEVLRHGVAPHLTRVEDGAHNLRDFGEGCLEGPTPNER